MEMATAVVRSGGLEAVLYFDAKRTPLPVVLALGKGEMTKVLLQVAKQAEVPIVEHRLAQSLAGVGRVAPFAVPGALIKAANLVIRQARAGVETKKAAAD